jgi:hypothetical protein
MKTLLEQAKEIKSSRRNMPTTAEERELALDWARDEISMSQASSVYARWRGKAHGMGVYLIFARALRDYIREKGL